ncbi:MAG: acyl-CoA dehydrogenase family protein, partial [Acidimicrobiia bacterium]|nr:acyl-CoA dehydrogenase family protein [Acidimicrobiia bacterium]
MGASHEELVDRARQLAPAIARRAELAETLRRPPDETIAELVDAELLSILVPRRWGGHELSIHTHREVTEIVSAACVSTGWIFAFYSGHNWMAVKFSEEAQREVFADRGHALIPITNVPPMQARRVDGGMVVSGRAQWGSGIVHADWVSVNGLCPDGSRHHFLVPAADTTLVDTWHMAAMAGTGSHDFRLDDVFVPEHRILAAAEFRSGDTEG